MQEKEVPVISVLMPVYNAAETLNAAVDSIRKQDYPDWELIAVDDGSTDSSGEILKHLARQDPRIHVHSISHGGIVAALQAAAAHAGGAYLARMDADDLARPERLRLQLDCFAADRALSICGGRVSMMGESIGFGRRRYEDWVNTLVSHDAIVREIFVECPLPHPTFMISRDWYDRVGGYQDCPWPEDYDFVMRLWQAGARFAKPEPVILDWRDHPKRLSMNDPRYDEAPLRALKRHYLAPVQHAGRPMCQWGAGEVGKRWLREWGSVSSSSPLTCPSKLPWHRWKGDFRGVFGKSVMGNQEHATPVAVVDINPRKIGRTIHGVRVIAPEELPPPSGCFIVVMVGTPGARDEIRDRLCPMGFEEYKDYLFLA